MTEEYRRANLEAYAKVIAIVAEEIWRRRGGKRESDNWVKMQAKTK